MSKNQTVKSPLEMKGMWFTKEGSVSKPPPINRAPSDGGGVVKQIEAKEFTD